MLTYSSMILVVLSRNMWSQQPLCILMSHTAMSYNYNMLKGFWVRVYIYMQLFQSAVHLVTAFCSISISVPLVLLLDPCHLAGCVCIVGGMLCLSTALTFAEVSQACMHCLHTQWLLLVIRTPLQSPYARFLTLYERTHD